MTPLERDVDIWLDRCLYCGHDIMDHSLGMCVGSLSCRCTGFICKNPEETSTRNPSAP